MKTPNLKLRFADNIDLCYLHVEDVSYYPDGWMIECNKLEITLPGFTHPNLTIDGLEPNFRKILYACDLNVQTDGCGERFDVLPDGIYIIRYSMGTKGKLFVEYNHLRIAQLLNGYYDLMCCLELKSEDSTWNVDKMFCDVGMFNAYLHSAKASVEWCHDVKRGMEHYRKACDILKKLKCQYCPEKCV